MKEIDSKRLRNKQKLENSESPELSNEARGLLLINSFVSRLCVSPWSLSTCKCIIIICKERENVFRVLRKTEECDD